MRTRATVTSGRWGGLEGLLVSAVPNSRRSTVLVLLHGFGGSPSGPRLMQAAKLIANRGRASVVIPAGLETYLDGRAWWGGDGKFWPAHASGDERGQAIRTPRPVGRARAAVRRVLVDVRKAFAPRRLVLGGYSQGAMLAIDVALASEPPVDGVAVLAGRLLSASLPALRGKAAGKITVFMAHGRADEVVPFAAGQQLKALLEQHGHAVTWRAFAGGHRLPSPKLLHELIAFIG